MWQWIRSTGKLVPAILVVTFLCFTVIKFILIPQLEGYCENKSKLEEIRSKVKVAEGVVASYKSESELAAMTERMLNEVKPLFDNGMNDGLALVHIGLEAENSNVQIVSYKPFEVIDKGICLEYPARLEVSGNYRNVNDFIEKLEHLPALSELKTITIKNYGMDATAQKQENMPVEMAPACDGTVTAVFNLVIYTSPAPEEQLKIEQVSGWATGRNNAFLAPDSISPYPGVKPLVKKPNAISGSESNIPFKPTSVPSSVYN